MITFRRGAERGHADRGWLRSHHTFSFADYYDPAHMGFRALRVINDDLVQPGRGFTTHAHADMEILTYVLEGALEHRDSLGNGSVIRPGDVQRMTAGTGVTHSEYNPSATEPVHFLQIWVLPSRKGLQPGYEQKTFAETEKRGRLCLIASSEGRDGSVTIHQDVAVYATLLGPGQHADHRLRPGRHAWLHVARGGLDLDGQPLRDGDGAAVSDAPLLRLGSHEGAEALLFDLA
jgi:hypothetical protein